MTTPTALDVVSVSLARQFLRGAPSGSVQDDVIGVLIGGAVEWLESTLGLFLYPRANTDYLDGGLEMLQPMRHPITALTEVYDTRTLAVLDETQYRLEGQRILYGAGIERPYSWPDGLGRWRVSYTAGYAVGAVPAGLIEAVLQLVFRSFQARGGVSSQGSQGITESFNTWSNLATSDLWAKIQPYRKGARF